MTILQMTDDQIDELHHEIDYIQDRVFKGDTTRTEGFVGRMSKLAMENNITFSELKIKFALRLKQRFQEGQINGDQLAAVPAALRQHFTLSD